MWWPQNCMTEAFPGRRYGQLSQAALDLSLGRWICHTDVPGYVSRNGFNTVLNI